MNKLITILILILVIGLGWWAFFGDVNQAPDQEEEMAREIVVSLTEQNDSGMSGTATLIEVADGIQVVLDLTGAPENIAQPAHIHENSCATIGGVLYPLEFPVNGSSETLLAITMDELLSNHPTSINVHKSPEEARIYVACGDIEML